MFPNEKQISQHRLIALAEQGIFTEFNEELDAAGHQETYDDFDFTECGQHLIARPKTGMQKPWGFESSQQVWFEDVTVDAHGVMTVQGQRAGTPATGNCHACGTSTVLPSGSTAAFCPSCGAQQAAPHVPGAQLAGQLAGQLGLPTPHAAPGQSPANPSVRMVGSNKPVPVQPEGLGKSNDKAGLLDFLDKILEDTD